MNSVSSQNTKQQVRTAQAYPFRSDRARSPWEGRGGENRREEGRGGKGEITTGKPNSGLQMNPLHSQSCMGRGLASAHENTDVWFV